MTFDATVPRIDGWQVVNPVPVLHGETKIGQAILELTDDPKVLRAIVTLDGGEDDAGWQGVRMGLNGQVMKFHDDGDGVRVVDEVRVRALVVG